MDVQLTKPLVFFDLETTGLNIGKDKIIQIALLKIMPDGRELEKSWFINPEMEISREAYEVHGISNADVADKPTFAQVADEVLSFFEDADIAGYNSIRFDLPLLMEEFLRAGKEFELHNKKNVDVQNIFHKMEPRHLSAAYKFYCHEEMKNAHDAIADVRATYQVLKGQLDKYEGAVYEDKKTKTAISIKNDVKTLSQFTDDNRFVDLAGHIILQNEVETLNFGKYKGQSIKTVFAIEPAYYDWMMKADFPRYTKKIITRIFNEVKFNNKCNIYNLM